MAEVNVAVRIGRRWGARGMYVWVCFVRWIKDRRRCR